jgi:hypothetical protein
MPSICDARPNTTAMSCREAEATVQRAGAIVMSTGPHTYQRFVAGISSCSLGEDVEPGTARTRDSERCQVGYLCKHRNIGGDR